MKTAFLGIDTSCYRTSAALYFPNGEYISERKLLFSPDGERGLRQSAAMFQHTKNLPEILEKLKSEAGPDIAVKAVGVSVSPTEESGSYMPVFLSGLSAASAAALGGNVPLYRFSHQQGHISAAEIGNGIKAPFLAFHVSGGTTELVIVDENRSCKPLFSASDLHAGQVLDRIGVLLGFSFPAGAEVDRLSLLCSEKIKVRASHKNGVPSFSGLENKCVAMLKAGESKEKTAKYAVLYVASALNIMENEAKTKLPVLYSGGVTESETLRAALSGSNHYFSGKELCGDNAVGIARLACMAYGGEITDIGKRA